MTDRVAMLLACGVWLGALTPVGESRPAALLALAAAAAAWRARAIVWLIALSAFASALAAGAAWAALQPVEAGLFSGVVTLRTDPEPVSGGVRVVVDVDGKLVDLRAWGGPAGHLRPRLMGERVSLVAAIDPLVDPPRWLTARGLVGRGTVRSVEWFAEGRPHTRLANSIRRTIDSGAASLSHRDRSLLTGLVYGDDRRQGRRIAAAFEASGLTHLLAVSGQNVAFVLALAGPLLRRLGHRGRFAATAGLLVVFATVTRFEPSVMRASAMTAVAAIGALVGSAPSATRVLSVGVAGLIVADPLIVHQLAFQLSVAASAGILFWSARVARALPGPRPIAETLAVTATAQLAVAPLVISRFGGLPVASLPANLLVAPAAGPVMIWGLTAGFLAGLVPRWLAEVLHWPTALAVGWIAAVAEHAPTVVPGRLGFAHAAALFVVAAVTLRRHGNKPRSIGGGILIGVLAHAAVG